MVGETLWKSTEGKMGLKSVDSLRVGFQSGMWQSQAQILLLINKICPWACQALLWKYLLLWKLYCFSLPGLLLRD